MTEKTGSRKYNYATFSAAADIKSPNYLRMVINGERNLSEDMIQNFAKALRLNREDQEEFSWLVKYGQESDPMVRNQNLKSLFEIRFNKKNQQGEISQRGLMVAKGWLPMVIHQMADLDGTNLNDPAEIQKNLRFVQKEKDIRLSIDNLVEAGVFSRDEDGKVKKCKDTLDDPNEVHFDLVKKVQSEFIYLGLESLFKDASFEREFGGATLNLTFEEFEKLKFELRKIRKSWHKDTSARRSESKGDAIYQLNIQLFPLTNPADALSTVKKMGPVKAPKKREEESEEIMHESTEQLGPVFR
jgi:uncharacterized protein (TIGR02147 family)